MMILAAAIAAVSSVIGLYVSYYVNVASGPVIVLTATLFFVLAWTFKNLQSRITTAAG
jgi:ABC-type Mn2+/Zn2+ transport system permease subunit